MKRNFLVAVSQYERSSVIGMIMDSSALKNRKEGAARKSRPVRSYPTIDVVKEPIRSPKAPTAMRLLVVDCWLWCVSRL